MFSVFRRLPAFLLICLILAACAGGGQPSSTSPAAVATAVPDTQVAPTSQPTTAAIPEDAFVNPVLKSNFPDPFLLKAGETWYAYATNGSGRNVQVASSVNLIDWKIQSDAMPTLAKWTKLTSSDVWAPEVMEIGGKYVLYYTARDKQSGKQCVGAAVSDKPEGKFKDPNTQALVCQTKEGGTIDASPYRDGDQLYLLYKNDGNCCGIATYLYIQPLAPDGLSLTGEPTRLIRNDKPWEGSVIEAPTMVKRDGKYYLFYSANGYAGPEYAVGYAVCDAPTGPCAKAAENPILKSQMTKPFVVGPGHQTLIQLGDQTWIVYHAWQINDSGARSDNRLMWIDRLNWVDGKPVVAGPTTGPQPKP